ncbi:MAG TPA: hypothetical protein PLH57_07840, partial [Oligoflexia bacterium]|nr:hypothetical protein [Oligoflexia bacterium]
FEPYLVPSIDGAIVVHENGGGATNRFLPAGAAPAEIEAKTKEAVEKIAAARSKLGAGFGASSAQDYKKRLLTDVRFRVDEWDRVFRAGLVKANPVKDGTVFKSNKYSFQTITRIKDTYVRKFDTGRVEVYGNNGRLMQVFDRNKNFVRLIYNKSGQMTQLVDNLNRKMTFSYNKNGKVEKILGENGKKVEYRYDGFVMVYRKNSDGQVYEYKYSNNGRYNLLEVKFPDKSTMKIDYNDVAKGETVASLRDRDGTLTKYTYMNDGVNGLYRGTALTVFSSDGKEISKAKYEYWDKNKLDGERYTYKMSTDVDGEKTETVYNECCGLPLVITRNGEKTSFEYDARGHVTRKTTPFEVTELTYDPQTNKVAKVARFPMGEKDPKKVNWATYKYDSKGNLVEARNSAGQGVKIAYNSGTGQIMAMVDQAKRRLEFAYNEANRPVEIRDPALGKIKVQYSASGDVQKVDTVGDRAIAGQITSAFQNLMELIRPAGVSLTSK